MTYEELNAIMPGTLFRLKGACMTTCSLKLSLPSWLR